MNFKRRVVCAIVIFNCLFFITLKGQSKKCNSIKRPKLVVGIVVDQMRWDYLYRYNARYGNTGFKRLLSQGFSCNNVQINYIPTVTAAGHTCIYTGSVPSIHGIVGNDFIIQTTGKLTYCTEDKIAKTVGGTSTSGEMSPKNLLVTTVTDELKLATNFRSKVIGIALKDRGGILPAGHMANAAYWFDDFSGSWITSTYYMKELPEWLKKFNSLKLAEKYLNQNWKLLYPLNTYIQSTEDSNRYETPFKGAEFSVMPIVTSKSPIQFGLIRNTPYGNSLTLDLAKEVIKQEKMGKHKDTDFLSISLSSTDYIGHEFGVNAVETEDTYLRLDKDLGDFFKDLDKKVGKDNYTVFLTADHGAAHNIRFLKDHDIPVNFWDTDVLVTKLNDLLLRKYQLLDGVLNITNSQVNLNNIAIIKKHLRKDIIENECVIFLEKQEGIQYVAASAKVELSTIPANIKERIVNGYNRERSGSIQIVLKPGWYAASVETGTNHGAWNPYDSHVPLLFMGWGIKHGTENKPISMTDIAPTIATLLHIQMPNGNIGIPISEVYKKTKILKH